VKCDERDAGHAAAVKRMTSVKGVGRLTALTYRLELGEPTRFESRREVGAYCGLVPTHSESGETMEHKGHITAPGPAADSPGPVPGGPRVGPPGACGSGEVRAAGGPQLQEAEEDRGRGHDAAAGGAPLAPGQRGVPPRGPPGRDTPEENILAMIEVAREYGRY
jgi:hypothetical protein